MVKKKAKRAGWQVWTATNAGLLAFTLCLVACPHPESDHREGGHADPIEAEVAPREPYLETFSCIALCHNELDVNPIERELTEFHSLRHVQHGPAIRWCEFCHDLSNLDQLHLIDGTAVSFDETYLICSQCHGQRYADWQAGIHGLQTGSWRERPVRRSCPFCHDPHVPGLPVVEALPAPERPEERWIWP